MSKIYIAADHAGYALKTELVEFLLQNGHAVEDCGASSLEEGDDYPEYVALCAHAVAKDANSFGIVIGAYGEGEAMMANRVPGIRAAVYYGASGEVQQDAEGNSLDIVASSRVHNDANILSLGARFITSSEAKEVVSQFLSTPASANERHVRRRAKLG